MTRWACLLITSLWLGACGGDHTGDPCTRQSDCPSNAFCCDTRECGSGMCTYECRHNQDCPQAMHCYHEVCLFTCVSDRDCLPGFACQTRNDEWLCVAR